MSIVYGLLIVPSPLTVNSEFKLITGLTPYWVVVGVITKAPLLLTANTEAL